MSYHSCSFLCLLVLLQAGWSIHVDRVVVPAMVPVGGRATLECWYREDGDKLYSLKWWHGDDNFYQYLPPNRRHFPVTGVYVNWTATENLNDVYGTSGVEIVVLDRVGLETGGVFKCEVLADNNFQTEFQQANMTVIHTPDGPPTITMAAGIQNHNISVGQHLVLNCSAPFASPPSVLTWYINDRQVNSSWVTTFPSRYRLNLAQATSRLEFTADERLILPGRTVVVTCLATQGNPHHIQPNYNRSAHLTLKAKQTPSFWGRMFSQGSNVHFSTQPVRHLLLVITISYLIPVVLFNPC